MTAGRTASVCVKEAPQPAPALDRPAAEGPLSLRLNFSWMLVGNVAYAGCQWAMLSVLAKLGTPAMVGQYVLALAITTPVMAFCMLQLRAVQATDARDEYEFGDYLALRLATTALALVAIAGIGVVSGYRRETALVIAAAGISAAINAMSDIVYGHLQRHERMDRIAQSMMLKGAISLVAVTGTLLASGQVFYAVLAVGASRAVVLLIWDLPNAASVLRGSSPGSHVRTGGDGILFPRWHAGRLLALAQLSLPMGLVMMLIALSNSIPRYFVERHLGEHSLGIFGAIALLGVVGTTAIGALGQSATPRLARYYARGQTASYGILLLKLAAVGAVIGAVGVVVALAAGAQILGVLYGPEYAEHSTILVWIMIAAAVGYVASFGGYGITAARYFRVQIPLFAMVAGTAAAACFWLVPGSGLLGAARALLVAALAQVLGTGLLIVHAIRAQTGMRSEKKACETFPEL